MERMYQTMRDVFTTIFGFHVTCVRRHKNVVMFAGASNKEFNVSVFGKGVCLWFPWAVFECYRQLKHIENCG
jgi:hypothetical protein